MKAAVLSEFGKFSWQDVPIPIIKDNEVLVKVGYAGICGSDMHVFHGDFKQRTPVPFIPGHEFAGVISEIGQKVKSHQVGDHVAVDPIIWCGQCAACQIGHYPACSSLKLIGIDMDGGFGEYVAVPEINLYKLPKDLSPRNAALIEIYSIGFHACNRVGLKQDDTTVIWGSGRVGQSILQAARTITQNQIFCVDVLDSQLEIAKQTYSDVTTINLKEQDPISIIKDVTNGRGVDVAFEAVGHAVSVPDRPNPVRGCVQTIRGAGTVCVLGLGDEPSPILMKELIWKEAKIVTSRVSHGEFKEAIQHLQEGHLKPEALISVEFPGSEIQNAFELLEKEPEKYLKVLLRIS